MTADSHVQFCRICWRFTSLKPAFQCSKCDGYYHLKCDTSDANLVRGSNGLFVNFNEVPKSKKHFNYCHLCQRIANKLSYGIIDPMMLSGNRTVLKHSLITMLSVCQDNPSFTSQPLYNVLNSLRECVIEDQVCVIEQVILILLNQIDNCLIETYEDQMSVHNNVFVESSSGYESSKLDHSTGLMANSSLETVLNNSKSLVRCIRKELVEIINCHNCYQVAKSNSKDHSFLKICDFPHFLVWAKSGNSPYWPAKLIWINSTHCQVQTFGDHKFLTTELNNVYELSEFYTNNDEGVNPWSFNIFTDDLQKILSSAHNTELPTIIRRNKEEFKNSIDDLKKYISKIDSKYHDSSAHGHSVSLSKYPKPITIKNYLQYIPYSTLLSPHPQYPFFSVTDSPVARNIDTRNFEAKICETFSVRCKLDNQPGSAMPLNESGDLKESQINFKTSSMNLNNINNAPLNAVPRISASNGSSSFIQMANSNVLNPAQHVKQRHLSLSASMFSPGIGMKNSYIDHNDDSFTSKTNLPMSASNSNNNNMNIISHDQQSLSSSNHEDDNINNLHDRQYHQSINSFNYNNNSNNNTNNSNYPNIMTNNANHLPTEFKKGRRKQRVPESSNISPKYYGSRETMYNLPNGAKSHKLNDSQIGHRLINFSSPEDINTGYHSQTIPKLQLPEDLDENMLPTADLISKLHQNLMNSIGRQVSAFCFNLMRSINSLPDSLAMNDKILDLFNYSNGHLVEEKYNISPNKSTNALIRKNLMETKKQLRESSDQSTQNLNYNQKNGKIFDTISQQNKKRETLNLYNINSDNNLNNVNQNSPSISSDIFKHVSDDDHDDDDNNNNDAFGEKKEGLYSTNALKLQNGQQSSNWPNETINTTKDSPDEKLKNINQTVQNSNQQTENDDGEYNDDSSADLIVNNDNNEHADSNFLVSKMKKEDSLKLNQ